MYHIGPFRAGKGERLTQRYQGGYTYYDSNGSRFPIKKAWFPVQNSKSPLLHSECRWRPQKASRPTAKERAYRACELFEFNNGLFVWWSLNLEKRASRSGIRSALHSWPVQISDQIWLRGRRRRHNRPNNNRHLICVQKCIWVHIAVSGRQPLHPRCLSPRTWRQLTFWPERVGKGHSVRR